MIEYMSEDKKTITLPVPYGSVFYAFELNCCELCRFFKGDFNQIVCDDLSVAPCHTVEGYIHECRMSVDYTQSSPYDITNALPAWGFTCFATREEAEEAMKKKLEMNRKYIEERYGIQMDEYGHVIWTKPSNIMMDKMIVDKNVTANDKSAVIEVTEEFRRMHLRDGEHVKVTLERIW